MCARAEILVKSDPPRGARRVIVASDRFTDGAGLLAAARGAPVVRRFLTQAASARKRGPPPGDAASLQVADRRRALYEYAGIQSRIAATALTIGT